MSSAPARLGVFGALLALLFAGGALAGGFIDPEARGGEPAARAGAEPAGAHGEPEQARAGDGDGEAHAPAPDAVRGLAVAAKGVQLDLLTPELSTGRPERLAFKVVDGAGRAVRDFDVAHERRMHLIVVRRDLRGFQHLHPRMGADGTWSTGVTLGEPGSYRVFADFERDGDPVTLADDVRVDGRADLQPLPAPAARATSAGGYDVTLHADGVRAGSEAELDFTVTRDGAPVRTEPYLGAGGHLVALREGDLAFLHVHPTEDVRFAATFPTPGRYRLFLQFKVDGEVQTVAFTHEVAR